jgi:hypothetical protein
MKTLLRLSMMFLFGAGAFVLTACASTPAESPVITQVVEVPVEVTRLVEVQSTIEITREVVVTQLVEVPVTVTPTATPEFSATPEYTATPTLGPTFTPGIVVPSTISEKKHGFAPLKVINETTDNLLVIVSGDLYVEIAVSAERSLSVIVPEGSFTYTVWRSEQLIYGGSFRVTNPDKHELVLRQDKAVFRVP